MVLNEKESIVLSYIKEDPFISQQDLANKVGLSRPAIANIISGLVRNGYLLGKAYVVNTNRPILSIGAAALDRRYLIEDRLYLGESNKISTEVSLGGMAVTMALSLTKLQEDVCLMSVIGDDKQGEQIKQELTPYLSVDGLDELRGMSTGSYMEVVNPEGEMVIGLSEMDIFDQMTPNWLNKHAKRIQQAKAIVFDTNLSKESTEALLHMTQGMSIPIGMVSVAALKEENFPNQLKGIRFFISTISQAAHYFNRSDTSESSIKNMLQLYLDRGIQHVFLTDQVNTIYYASKKFGVLRFLIGNTQMDHAIWGMNEALLTGMMYRALQTDHIMDIIKTGIVHAFHTSKSTDKVRATLSQPSLEKEIKAYGPLSYERM